MLVLSLGHAVQRWLRDVYVTRLDKGSHLRVEKSEEQRPDVRAVHVGVGHDNDLVVTGVVQFEVITAQTGTDCRDHRADFDVG